MSYESPIRIIEKGLSIQMEDDVMKVVKSYSVDVNREELIKALKFDRDQYVKGYNDGKNYRLHSSVKPIFYEDIWICGECSTPVGWGWVYCQHCGQRINWSEVDEND